MISTGHVSFLLWILKLSSNCHSLVCLVFTCIEDTFLWRIWKRIVLWCNFFHFTVDSNNGVKKLKSKSWTMPWAFFFSPLCCSQENRRCQPQKLLELHSCEIWLSLVRWGRWRHHYGWLLTFKAFEIKGWNSALFKRLLCMININQTRRTQTVLLGLSKNNVPVDFL